MKTRLAPFAFATAALLFSGPALLAQPAPANAAPREVTVVVVEQIGRHPDQHTTFDRLDIALHREFLKKRKWPVKLSVERFGDNLPAHETEVRIYLKGIYREMPDDLTFHAWVTYADATQKKDFGMVLYRYYPRPGEPSDDVLEGTLQGAAGSIADKIAPLLFPEGSPPKS